MIDWSEALAMIGGDEMLLVEVIEAFQQETPQVMADLRKAILTRDTRAPPSLRAHAQELAADLGATASGETAFALETLGRNNELHGADPLFATLESELPAIHEEFKRFVHAKRRSGG